jgi:hypothetical protein
MYIKLFIILAGANLPLFALRLFDCENLLFWNPFYFILQNKYIMPVFYPFKESVILTLLCTYIFSL